MELAKRLETLRKKQHLSIKEVALYLGIPISTYRGWEMGTKIGGEPYMKLASLFKTDICYLMYGIQVDRKDFVIKSIMKIKDDLEILARNVITL